MRYGLNEDSKGLELGRPGRDQVGGQRVATPGVRKHCHREGTPVLGNWSQADFEYFSHTAESCCLERGVKGWVVCGLGVPSRPEAPYPPEGTAPRRVCSASHLAGYFAPQPPPQRQSHSVRPAQHNYNITRQCREISSNLMASFAKITKQDINIFLITLLYFYIYFLVFLYAPILILCLICPSRPCHEVLLTICKKL